MSNPTFAAAAATLTEAPPVEIVAPLFDKGTSVNITRNPEAMAALARLKELKAIEKAGAEAEKERKELIEPILRQTLGRAEFLVIRGINALKVQASSNSKIDAETLKVAWPEAYAATYKSTPYTFLKAL